MTNNNRATSALSKKGAPTWPSIENPVFSRGTNASSWWNPFEVEFGCSEDPRSGVVMLVDRGVDVEDDGVDESSVGEEAHRERATLAG